MNNNNNPSEFARKAARMAYRANAVRQDPAVIKVASEASKDLTVAARSTSRLLVETRSAWHRSGL